MDFNHLKLENQICHRLYTASNKMTKLYRPLLKELNLTYPQYIIMMALWEKKTETMLKLSKLTNIDKGSLSEILKKLESKAFLEIAIDKDDKRLKHISLTPLGEQLKLKANSIPEKLMCKGHIDFEKIKLLINLLDELNSSFSK